MFFCYSQNEALLLLKTWTVYFYSVKPPSLGRMTLHIHNLKSGIQFPVRWASFMASIPGFVGGSKGVVITKHLLLHKSLFFLVLSSE